MKGQQEISKKLILQISNLENSVGAVSGQIEETKFDNEQEEKNKAMAIEQEIQALQEKQKLNSEKSLKLEANIKEMNQKINEQKKYLEKLLKEIKKITKKKKA